MTPTAAALARLIWDDPSPILQALADSLSSLSGAQLSAQLLDESGLAAALGEGPSYVYVVGAEGGTPPISIALDLAAAVRACGSLAVADEQQIQQVLASGQLTDGMADSAAQVGTILCGTLSQRLPENSSLESAGVPRRIEGGWSPLVTATGLEAARAGARLLSGGSPAGALIVAADSGHAPDAAHPQPLAQQQAAEPPAAAAPKSHALTGVVVRLVGSPADPSLVALSDVVRHSGAQLMPLYSAPREGQTPDALLIVTRSPADLGARLDLLAREERPTLVIACSDRPTRALVLCAKSAGADGFLVLPASCERLLELLGKLALSPA